MEFVRVVVGGALLLAALPGTSTYKLNSYGFGSGGTADSGTSTYRLQGSTGQVTGGQVSATSTYSTKPGYIQTEQANVPAAPTFTNPNNYYDKLALTINQSNNPSDAKYAIAISNDNFASDTRYIKSDHTIGSSLSTADYQTYAVWGGASGFTVIGLASSTTYTVKVKATQGKFTESVYGPTAQAATVGQQFTFSLSTNSEAMGVLAAGTVVNSPSNITANIDTNANSGGNVYVTGLNAGLYSTLKSFTITSATADLASSGSGFGVQGVSASQSSGGPLSISVPYNGTGQNVGLADANLRTVFHATAPIGGGQGVFMLKAKADTLTPATTDYAETLTVIGAAIY